MRYIVVLSLIFTVLSVSGREFDAVRYSNMVNKAELAFIDTAYGKAVVYYDSAFSLKEKPFAVDIYNASVCAIKMFDKPKALSYCVALSESGVGDSFLSVVPVYDELKQMPQWQSILANAKTIKDSIMYINRRLYKTLGKLNGALLINNENVEKKNIDVKTFSRIKDSLISVYYRICQETSIPSRDVFQLEYTMEKGCRARDLYQNLTFTGLRSEKYGPLFIGLLQRKMKSGEISTFDYANLLDYGGNGKRPYYGAKVFDVLDCSILTTKPVEVLSKVDSARRLIGIGSLNDHVKKIAYNTVQLPLQSFIIWPGYYVIVGMDAKEKIKRIQNSTTVLKNIPGCKKN